MTLGVGNGPGLTRREAMQRAGQGLSALIATAALIPEVAAAAAAAAPGAVGGEDLDTLVVVIAAVAQANRLSDDAEARALWRSAVAEACATHDDAGRAAVRATCARLRSDAQSGVMAGTARPSETRLALRSALASRSRAEREFEKKVMAAATADKGPRDLAAWLDHAQKRIETRHADLKAQIGDDPTAIDQESGLLKYRDHFAKAGPDPDISAINDPADPAVAARLAGAAAVSMAAAILFSIPVQPEI